MKHYQSSWLPNFTHHYPSPTIHHEPPSLVWIEHHPKWSPTTSASLLIILIYSPSSIITHRCIITIISSKSSTAKLSWSTNTKMQPWVPTWMNIPTLQLVWGMGSQLGYLWGRQPPCRLHQLPRCQPRGANTAVKPCRDMPRTWKGATAMTGGCGWCALARYMDHIDR